MEWKKPRGLGMLLSDLCVEISFNAEIAEFFAENAWRPASQFCI